MNNKLIFRILGAISSALIVVSVFLPYVSVTGYSESLWHGYEISNTLYLPIMIVVFGVIGVVFFSINIKTEFAYASAGAVLFFVIIQTFDVVNQGTFNTLSVGYYFLAIGSVLTGVMAFLCNLKSNQDKTKSKPVEVQNDIVQSPLNQINNLYDQNMQQEVISPIQPINNIVEPIQSNSIPEINSIPEVNTISNQPLSSISEPVQVQPVQPIPEIQPNIPQSTGIPVHLESNVQAPVNPVVQQFEERPVNPVVKEFMINNSNTQNSVGNTNNTQPILGQNQNAVPLNTVNEPVKVNPVVQEFTNPAQGLKINQNVNNNETDIFGQPINK